MEELLSAEGQQQIDVLYHYAIDVAAACLAFQKADWMSDLDRAEARVRLLQRLEVAGWHFLSAAEVEADDLVEPIAIVEG